MEFTNELIEKANKCETVEELICLAKENDIELTEEVAEQLFAKLENLAELTESELNDVAGGATYGQHIAIKCKCPNCGSAGNVKFEDGCDTYTCVSCGNVWRVSTYITIRKTREQLMREEMEGLGIRFK